MSSREYNPCGRNNDVRDQPTPYAEDASDDYDDRDHPTPYAKDASDDDDRDHPTPYVEDASDDEEGRGEQAPYVEDSSDNENEDAYSMSSRECDGDPQEVAAHYVYMGEDRCGYHRGSWMYLIKTSWKTIQIEAPYRPPDDLPAVPRTPVHHGAR